MVKLTYQGTQKALQNIDLYSDLVEALGVKPKDIYYVKVNGILKDMSSRVLENNFELEIFDHSGEDRNQFLWHTSAHIVAQAIKRLYPHVKEAIGPVTETGFFEDIDFIHDTLTLNELEAIEKVILDIIQEDYVIEQKELTRQEALDLFQENPYKIANIQKIPEGEKITVYKQGEYQDLCRGMHLYSTGQVNKILLTNISSAYFMGDKNQKALQRVSGISFVSQKECDKYLFFMEEAKKRDHRKLGKELNLFSIHPESPGFIFWHHKGNVLFNTLTQYMRNENIKRGYTEIKTPNVLDDELWKKSGHYDNFHENMYFTDIDERSFALKPMNCPGGCLVYKNNLHSYRDLPLKQAEFGLVHRHELSGVLQGLFRVRAFTQDDAHIFCTLEQLEEQVLQIIEYIVEVYKKFEFKEVKLFVATRPDKSIGSDEEWEMATNALKKSIEKKNIPYKIKEKEGAFYGPKIEFNILDSLERNWQCGTVQIDFSMPKRFGLTYEGSDGQHHTPVMIHRAILGSFERFIGILIEHFEGKFPLWLSPVQIRLLNVSDAQKNYMEELCNYLHQRGVRVETDYRNETLGYKVRFAKTMRVPLIGVIGDEEMSLKTVSVKDRDGKSITYNWSDLVDFIFQESY